MRAKDEAHRENVVAIELVDLNRLIEIVIDERIGVKETMAYSVDSSFYLQYQNSKRG